MPAGKLVFAGRNAGDCDIFLFDFASAKQAERLQILSEAFCL